MAFQPTTDGAMAVLRFTGSQGPWANILWFRKAEFDYDDQTALANALHQAGSTDWSNIHSTANAFQQVDVYDMRTQDGPVAISLPPSIPFGGSAGPLPLSVCAVLTLRTTKRGRSFRGRVFLAGFHEAAWDGTAFQAAVGAAWSEWFDDRRADALAAGWEWCVRSGVQNGVVLPAAELTPVLNHEFRNLDSASQRRRNRRP